MVFPDALRRSIARHDGQDSGQPTLVDSGILMPLQQIVDELRTIEEAMDDGAGWRRGWLGFVSRDGDYLSVDLAPGGTPRYGRVWSFLHDNDPLHAVMAPDLTTWLMRWADELERGVHTPDPVSSDLAPRGGRTSRLWPG